MVGVASALAGLGIRGSAVRDVAEAVGSDDQERVGRTIITLRRVCWLTGIAGFAILFCLAGLISMQVFGSMEHVWSIRLLGITVLFSNVTGGQAAIIQGTRRIGDIARIAIIASASSMIISVGLYYSLGIAGIVPALLCISAIALAVSTWFARRIDVPRVTMTWRESLSLAGGLVSLGLAFVWTGLSGTLVAYLTNVLITREIGISAVGIHAAAFTLSGMFVGFVLQTMGADYYPRLTQVSTDNAKMNALINDQTEIGLLLAFPGLLATLVLAPLAIPILYTSEFTQSTDLLRWFVLGCMGRIISWPLGYSMLAKGKGVVYAATETVFNILHVLMMLIGIRLFGLVGVAIAYSVLCALYIPGAYLVTRALTGFSWNRDVIVLCSLMLPLLVLNFAASLFLSQSTSMAVGISCTIIATFCCLRQLAIRVGPEHRISRTVMRLPAGRFVLPQSLFD